jgi:hypothetical protein
MANKNKNNLIHELKEFVKNNGKKYRFPIQTKMVLDRYDEYIDTRLLALVFTKGKLELVSSTDEYGVEVDNLSDFHSDIVNDVYKIVMGK